MAMEAPVRKLWMEPPASNKGSPKGFAMEFGMVDVSGILTLTIDCMGDRIMILSLQMQVFA